jgi:hypothetical protein
VDELTKGISSLSGSISSSGSSTPSVDLLTAGTDKVSRLLKRQTFNPGAEPEVDSDEEAEAADRRRRAELRTSIIWFTVPTGSSIQLLSTIPQDTQFGIHRALFPNTLTNSQQYLSALKAIQLQPGGTEEDERRFTLLMVAGGHFAGMVVSLTPAGKNDKQTVKGAGELRILRHKTFHRYTSEYMGVNPLIASSKEAGWITVDQRQCQVQGKLGWCYASSIWRTGTAGGDPGAAD